MLSHLFLNQNYLDGIYNEPNKNLLSENTIKLLGPEYDHVTSLYRSMGCEQCGHDGYKGRVVVTEILSIDRELDDMILSSVGRKEMINHAIKKGFKPMVEDGLIKVVEGLIDLKELVTTVDMTDRM